MVYKTSLITVARRIKKVIKILDRKANNASKQGNDLE